MTTWSAIAAAVRTRVADHEEASPGELPPVDDWVAPETRLELATADRNRTEPVEFTYLWYHVTVSPDGEVTVTP